MTNAMPSKPALKEKFGTELKEFFWITAYLFVSFSALTFYKSAMLQEQGIHWLPWGFAIVKAAISAKIILIGRALHIGEGHRTTPLIWQTLHKTVAFLILVAGFTVIEEAIVGHIHGQTFWQSMNDIGGGTTEGMIATAVIMFLIFIPIFALGALGEVVGDKLLMRTFFVERLQFEPVHRPAPIIGAKIVRPKYPTR